MITPLTHAIDDKLCEILKQWEESPETAPEHVQKLMKKEKEIFRERIKLKRLWYKVFGQRCREARKQAIKQLGEEYNSN
jgi:hypothetical protein